MAQYPAEIFIPPPLPEGQAHGVSRKVQVYLVFITFVSLAVGFLIGHFADAPSPSATVPPPSTVHPFCSGAPVSSTSFISSDDGLLWAVYVSGAVQQPQVVKVPPDSLVADALAAAGGPAPNADLDAVNLAAPLQNHQHIHIPARNTTPMTKATPVPLSGLTSTPITLININTADATTLEKLPKIGPSMAQRIIEYRQLHGPFQTIADIQKVSGIGPSVFAAIEPYITVGP